jgi:hypothetical protein
LALTLYAAGGPSPALGNELPTSNGNRFERGDVDGTGNFDLSDSLNFGRYLFLGDYSLPCDDAADVDDSGYLDLSDLVNSLRFLILGTFEIPAPYGECGEDPTQDALGCGAFPSCPGVSESQPMDDLAERLTLFIGAEIEPEDIQLRSTQQIHDWRPAPDYMRRAFVRDDSEFLLVTVDGVGGFSRATFEVPADDRDAYLGAAFVMALTSVTGATIDSYGCRRCNPSGGGCPLKQFSYPCTDNCSGCGGSVTKWCEYSKCNGGGMVTVTVEMDVAGSCRTDEQSGCGSPLTTIVEDLGL